MFQCFSVLCRYGKWTHGIFEKLGIPGPKPVMYLGTVGRHNKVCNTELIRVQTMIYFVISDKNVFSVTRFTT